MRRLMVPAVLLVLLLVAMLLLASALGRSAAAPMAGGAARVAQVDAGAYPEITLYVAVEDEAGRPVAGLGSDDFTVTEDGAPVEVAAFGGAGAGAVSTVLVLDRSLSMDDEGKLAGAQEAAAAFVDLMRPGDQAALLAFNHTNDLAAAFTGDQAELHDAIEGLRPDGGTALYDAVATGVELLRDAPGRRLLLVLSDGQDCSVAGDACPDEYGSSTTLDEAIAYAVEAGQPVAVVGLGDRAGRGQEGIDEDVLREIAAATGGSYFYAPRAEDLAGLYAGLAGEVQQEYRLTYVSPRPFYDGTRRDIRVSVGGNVAAGGYTEQHLINVVANPWVGLGLLTPLVVLLVAPGVRRKARGGAPGRAGGAVGEGSAPAVGQPALTVAPAVAAGPALVVVPEPSAPAPVTPVPAGGARRCVSCDAVLRGGARFCPTCGTTQPASVVGRRTFCDMCGQPLEPGSKFCMGCGEPVTRRG